MQSLRCKAVQKQVQGLARFGTSPRAIDDAGIAQKFLTSARVVTQTRHGHLLKAILRQQYLSGTIRYSTHITSSRSWPFSFVGLLPIELIVAKSTVSVLSLVAPITMPTHHLLFGSPPPTPYLSEPGFGLQGGLAAGRLYIGAVAPFAFSLQKPLVLIESPTAASPIMISLIAPRQHWPPTLALRIWRPLLVPCSPSLISTLEATHVRMIDGA